MNAFNFLLLGAIPTSELDVRWQVLIPEQADMGPMQAQQGFEYPEKELHRWMNILGEKLCTGMATLFRFV